MNQFTEKATKRRTAVSKSAEVVAKVQAASRTYGAYVGLDVHKDTIAIAVAECGRGQPDYRGEIANTPKKVGQLIERLSAQYGGEQLLFVYEAGPCGYGLYRQIVATGHACEVVAPSLIPRKAGERIKTDRRDALGLARLARSGDLSAVWVPGPEHEAIRDLTRAERRHQSDGDAGAATLGRIFAAPRLGLSRRQEPLDAGAFSLAGAGEVRLAGAADRVAGVH